MKNSFEKIDKLFLDDDSKNLLKQIIEYIRKYYEKIETNYVSFNFTINTNNNEVIDTISNIMKDINNSFNFHPLYYFAYYSYYYIKTNHNYCNRNEIYCIHTFFLFYLLL